MGGLTAVDSVDGAKCDEECFQRIVLIDSIKAERHVEENRECIFAAINQMRKRVPGIIVTTYALQASPNARQC